MADTGFLTNVATAFLSLFTGNAMLSEYNWQYSDSDKEVELPRGILSLSSKRDPQESPYRRIEVMIKFEGRPKKQKLTAVMNELQSLLEQTEPSDLTELSKNTVAFIGHAINVVEDRPIEAGLRMWTLGFTLYAVPLV